MDTAPVEIRLVYELNSDIGKFYNYCMANAKTEWVLFLDHDLFICNPAWYHMTCRAALEADKNVGLISAVTNRLASDRLVQLAPGCPTSDDIAQHIKFAHFRQSAHKDFVVEVDPGLPPFSGFYFLTSRRAWKKAGGFSENCFLGADDRYSNAIVAAGLRRQVITGLYFYHLRERKEELWKSWQM